MAVRSLELCPDNVNRLALYYMGLKHNWRNFPTPATLQIANSTTDENVQGMSRNLVTTDERFEADSLDSTLSPGALPGCARDMPNAARGLLLRLLEQDPKVRLKSLRQLQQTAFYMGFNFEHVKTKKISPKCVLLHHMPEIFAEHSKISHTDAPTEFLQFNQPML